MLHAEHSVFYYEAKTDSKKQTITLKSDRDSTNQFHLKYNRKQGDLLELSGVFESDTIKGNFKIKRKNDFQLMKRKFNLIHEYPYNR